MDSTRTGSLTQVSVRDGYGQFMLGQLVEPWAPDPVARAGLQPGRCVLDMASGLGPSPGSRPKPAAARRSLTATWRRTRTAVMLGNLVAKMTARHHAEQGDLSAAT
jgi:hypothetical protein